MKILILLTFAASLQAADTCWISGSGPTYWKVCVSDIGSVTKFESPLGVSHMAQGPGAFEGFTLIYEIRKDAGYDGSGVWQDDCTWTKINASPLTLRGKCYEFEVTQVFTRDTVRRELTIDHTVKYAFPLSDHFSRPPEICRYANINASNKAVNDFVIGNKSIAAIQDSRGISVHNIGAVKDLVGFPGPGNDVSLIPFSEYNGYCYFLTELESVGDPAFRGDGVSIVRSFKDSLTPMVKGATFKLKVAYRAF